ncbi:MAG: hypothetical protein LUC93_02930 [Planctomycetaceae bacterium]|nr:hypothetical protein [Planctomycetaceae bacterium]
MKSTTIRGLRLLLLAALVLVYAAEAHPGDPAEELPARGRVAALLTALFYHEPPVKVATGSVHNMEGAQFGSVSPSKALGLRERAKVVEFAGSLVYEGGYYPKEIYTLLGYENVTTARVARRVRQLDAATGSRPQPWEVAGRVGRSGMRGSSDNWAMAPGEAGEGISTPGTLAYLPTLAVVYAAYPEDGLEAATQLAVLKDDDLRCGPVARAAFSLLRRVLISQTHDKDAWLRMAAADSGDTDTEHDLRAVRVKDWKYLRGEECAMGRFERAIFLWYKGDGYESTLAQGREMLRSRESLAYLAALAGVTYGQESLPMKMVASGASDRQLLDMVNDLYDLATSEAVLRVAPQED